MGKSCMPKHSVLVCVTNKRTLYFYALRTLRLSGFGSPEKEACRGTMPRICTCRDVMTPSVNVEGDTAEVRRSLGTPARPVTG